MIMSRGEKAGSTPIAGPTLGASSWAPDWRRKMDKRRKKKYCKECGLQFSEWFVHEGVSYCYPCQLKHGKSIREDKPVHTEYRTGTGD